MSDALPYLLGGVVAVAGVLAYRNRDAVESTVVSAMAEVKHKWSLPDAGVKFSGAIDSAAREAQIPAMLLARVLDQESKFKDSIVYGSYSSSKGALGIAQFMPATAKSLGIDPLNPYSAIRGAAVYLRTLYDKFGRWTLALAAYNWGEGNVAQYQLANAPKETKAYYTDILADVGDYLNGWQI